MRCILDYYTLFLFDDVAIYGCMNEYVSLKIKLILWMNWLEGKQHKSLMTVCFNYSDEAQRDGRKR